MEDVLPGYEQGEDTALDASLLARFSQAAYDPYSHHNKIPGWIIDHRVSDRNKTVFSHVYGPEAVVAYRGTDMHNVSDLLADGFVTVGQELLSGRFQRASNTARMANVLYGKNNVTLTGHSLGGAEALFASRRTGNKTAAFNPGAAFADVRQGLADIAMAPFFPENRSNATIYTTGVDPISLGSLFGPEKKVLYRPRGGDVHGIGNFVL